MINIADLLNEFGDRVVSGLKDNLASENLGNSSLSESISYEQDGNEIIVSAAGYWPYAEKGRGPGKTPYNFIDILTNWMHKYSVTPMKGTETNFAWAIKRKIENEGSSIYRGERPERDFIRTTLDDEMDWLENEMVAYVIERIDEKK